MIFPFKSMMWELLNVCMPSVVEMDKDGFSCFFFSLTVRALIGQVRALMKSICRNGYSSQPPLLCVLHGWFQWLRLLIVIKVCPIRFRFRFKCRSDIYIEDIHAIFLGKIIDSNNYMLLQDGVIILYACKYDKFALLILLMNNI